MTDQPALEHTDHSWLPTARGEGVLEWTCTVGGEKVIRPHRVAVAVKNGEITEAAG